MRRGLVIGKFMPVHQGHISLIRFAATHCDELIVSMSHKSDDPISGSMRFAWLNEIFKSDSFIKIHSVVDDFDDESLPWYDRTKAWADFLYARYGRVNVIISSEEYGPYLANHLNAKHVEFDSSRKIVPVSASSIRLKPFANWKYIPEVVRPYFVNKICFYGPESTGKSTMAAHLAKVYNTEWVPEVAREMVTSNDFTIDDIIRIGHAQTKRIQDKLQISNRILFCDTDLITTQIYCRHYLGVVPDVLFELEKQINYDQYFLFDIDVPWISDGLRDLGNRRIEMFNVFKEELEKRNIAYKLIKGSYREREEFLRSHIDALLAV